MNDDLNEALDTAVTLPSGYFSGQAYSTKVWDVWNDRTKQRGRWFGASTVAWKITNLYRTERAVWEMDDITQWLDVLRRNLTEQDWVDLGKQADHLWTYFSPAEREEFTEKVAHQFVLRKVIIDTHNGLYREHRAKWDYLMTEFPGVAWRYATPEEDRNTGFDLFGYVDDVLVVAVSVKPPSYKYKSSATAGNKSKEIRKHAHFINAHPGVEVFQLSDPDGKKFVRDVLPATMLTSPIK